MPKRDLDSLALGVLTDLTVSYRHAIETADRLARRWTIPRRHFVIGMGGWLRNMKAERQPDEIAELRWADDGGIAAHE